MRTVPNSDDNPSARVARWIATGIATAILTSCQTYEPQRLDLDAHDAAWRARALDTASFDDLAQRIAGGAEALPPGAFDATDGLSWAETRLLALVFNASLRIARLEHAGAVAEEVVAGRLADPKLSVDALRISESVPDRWVLTTGIAFSLPLSGRRAAERGVARAEVRASEQAVRAKEWEVLHTARRKWIERAAIELRLTATQQLIDTLTPMAERARRLAEAGELERTEAALFRIERARLEGEHRRLRGERAAADFALRAVLGLAPDAPVAFDVSLAEESPRPIAADVDGREVVAEHPSLVRLSDAYAAAEAALELEIAEQGPELELGPLFESDAGQSRFGLLAGVPLPLWNANRRGIAAARSKREIARAVYESHYEALVSRWATAQARARFLDEEQTALEVDLVPLIGAQIEDALALFELGEGNSLVVLESLTRAHAAKLDWLKTRVAAALVRAELDYLAGPTFETEEEAR